MQFPSPHVKSLYRAVTSAKTFKPEKWSCTHEEAIQVCQCLHDSGKINIEHVQNNIMALGIKKSACAHFKTHMPAQPKPQTVEEVQKPPVVQEPEKVTDVPTSVQKRKRPRSEVEKEIATLKREIRELNGDEKVLELRKKLKLLKLELNSCV